VSWSKVQYDGLLTHPQYSRFGCSPSGARHSRERASSGMQGPGDVHLRALFRLRYTRGSTATVPGVAIFM